MHGAEGVPAERRGSFSACNSEKSAEGHTPACGIPPLNGGKKLQPRSTPLPAFPTLRGLSTGVSKISATTLSRTLAWQKY